MIRFARGDGPLVRVVLPAVVELYEGGNVELATVPDVQWLQTPLSVDLLQR